MVKVMQIKMIISKTRLGFLVVREVSKRKPNRLFRSKQELRKRRKELLGIRDQMKRDIKKSDNPAELRWQLDALEQTLIEYKWLFKEIE